MEVCLTAYADITNLISLGGASSPIDQNNFTLKHSDFTGFTDWDRSSLTMRMRKLSGIFGVRALPNFYFIIIMSQLAWLTFDEVITAYLRSMKQ